jgi:hypothetical protein
MSEHLDPTKSQCFTCKHGICSLKRATEQIFDVRTAHPVVEDATFFTEDGEQVVDEALTAHNELFGQQSVEEEDDKEVTSNAFTTKTFIHGICCHPILKEQIDVPFVIECSGYEEKTS